MTLEGQGSVDRRLHRLRYEHLFLYSMWVMSRILVLCWKIGAYRSPPKTPIDFNSSENPQLTKVETLCMRAHAVGLPKVCGEY